LTRNLISLHILNVKPNKFDANETECEHLYKFIHDNLKWMLQEIKNNPNDPYWHQVNLVLTQFNGLYHGYEGVLEKKISNQNFLENIEKKEQKNLIKLLTLQLIGDIDEILFKIKNIVDPFWASSCSAMIKIIGDNSDLLVGHNMWASYENMLRIAKHYKFNYHINSNYDILIPSVSLSFSSYPGMIFSFDDFYLTSSNLTILETTIGNSNVNLWQFTKPDTILYWIRSLVSSRLSKNGLEWSQWYSFYNSGTYNNQWMVIDYKKFFPNQPLVDGLLFVVEQIPGHVVSKDMTNILREKTYWSSFNLPYFDEIRNISGNYENVKIYGEFLFSHDDYSRSKIFSRDHVNVKDIDSMIKLMRYNNYTKDPLSRCDSMCINPNYSAFLAISARSDLTPINGIKSRSSL
jgi:hypothetical protein